MRKDKKIIREDHDKKKLYQKKHFDKRHRAHEKNVAIGDKVLVKQQKSTTKPPYDHRSYTVTETVGNKIVMKRADGSKRVRDKNQIKILKERPVALKPSWDSKTFAISDYASFDIEGKIGDIATDSTRGSERSISEEFSRPETENQDPVISMPEGGDSETEDEHEGSGLFVLNEEAEARMRLLLATATDAVDQSVDDNRRVTRSRGTQLHWNPCMNDKEVLTSAEEE